MTVLRLLPLLPLASITPCVHAADTPLRVENAWVREAPPGADVQAAYGRFCNDGAGELTLASVASADFDTVEMHATVETDTSVHMEKLHGVTIESGRCATFAPGGRHFMLFGPKRALRAGDAVKFVLRFADGGELQATFPVRRGDDVIDHQHGQQHAH